ncbi:hypothetical protein [Quisquiliibacterium transsilvanicum]|uniref:Flp pilus assembly pilin Flp n=1 Tax=Quisquiliibacterium transsilvanicum TaxID=1549638 RepID=A0A7W8M7R9_9BURK|nr:hypothetical protein [Quisquiliibacterium transsilvanicum]MBB5271063.1 Flp pilus assembly pilin Flp [Quisquiliibacterium transsilvanicum]
MDIIIHRIRSFAWDEQGAAASEYAIVVAFVAAAIALAVSEFDLNPIFATISSKILAIVSGA